MVILRSNSTATEMHHTSDKETIETADQVLTTVGVGSSDPYSYVELEGLLILILMNKLIFFQNSDISTDFKDRHFKDSRSISGHSTGVIYFSPAKIKFCYTYFP